MQSCLQFPVNVFCFCIMHPVDLQYTKKSCKVRKVYSLFIHTHSFDVHVHFIAAFIYKLEKTTSNEFAFLLSITDTSYLVAELAVHLTI